MTRSSRRLILGAVGLCLATSAAPWISIAHASEQAAPVTLEGPGEQQFVVPAGVTSVSVRLIGAHGGAARVFIGSNPQGGAGAQVEAGLQVVPGERLFVEIGGAGAEATNAEVGAAAGGSNGGGAGAYGEFPAHARGGGGGGGGATDVRTCSVLAATLGQPPICATTPTLASRLVVAGGGGGAGGESSTHGAGGAGAGAGGEGSNGTPDTELGGGGGHAGSSSAGGAGGAHSEEREGAKSREEFPGRAGTLGVGGLGGGYKEGGGGGGGGGIFGGGGGGGGNWELESATEHYGAGGGGGGGGSGRPAGAIGVSVTEVAPAPGAAPSAIFTWTLPPPAAITGPAQSVTSSSALLTGIVNADGSAVSDCHFTIAPAPASGPTVPCAQQVGAGASPVSVSASLAGLAPASAYVVTLVAASAQGRVSGAPVGFSTPAAGTGGPGRAGRARRGTDPDRPDALPHPFSARPQGRAHLRRHRHHDFLRTLGRRQRHPSPPGAAAGSARRPPLCQAGALAITRTSLHAPDRARAHADGGGARRR